MQRRDFIIKGSIIGASLISRTSSKSSISNNTKLQTPGSVVIIGAGFAGLAAGLSLVRAGIQVTILEAKNRIGGRVFSYKPEKSANHIIEFGAEWVGASHERIISLCDEFGLVLENNQFETDLILNGRHSKAGKWSYSDKMTNFWENLVPTWNALSEVERQKLDKQDWWRYLQSAGLSQEDLLMRDLIDSTDFGESIRHTSAYAAFAEYAESSEKNEMDFKIRGGNILLIEKMAAEIGYDKIFIDQTVASIDQKDIKKVVVTCTNGKKYTAEKIICTVPTNALMQIDWSPKLPEEKIEALHELQYARIGKFPIVCKERFWKRDDFDMVTDTPAHYFYHGTKNQIGKSGIMMCYAVGDKADVLASVDRSQRLSIIIDALKPAFGNIKKYITDDLKYYWGQDKHSLGAYAFYGKNQWFEVMPTLKRPFKNAHFAGEHLADWQGFMEGAVNSGEETAQSIIDGL